jgi:hypothetical protein
MVMMMVLMKMLMEMLPLRQGGVVMTIASISFSGGSDAAGFALSRVGGDFRLRHHLNKSRKNMV